MSIIRGKIESPREIVQKSITIGGPTPFQRCTCGCEKWFNIETGEEIKSMTLDEFLEQEKISTILCTKPNDDKEMNINELYSAKEKAAYSLGFTVCLTNMNKTHVPREDVKELFDSIHDHNDPDVEYGNCSACKAIAKFSLKHKERE